VIECSALPKGEKLTYLQFCQDRSVLLDVAAAASKNYASAASELCASAPILSRVDYQIRRRQTEALRAKSANARKALLDHQMDHGC
jgi:hypothetical protein